MLMLWGWKYSKVPETEKSQFSLIQFNYFKPKVTRLYARGPNKDRKGFLHSNKCFLRPRDHGNFPIATDRSHLQEQEWVRGHQRWDTQALHSAK